MPESKNNPKKQRPRSAWSGLMLRYFLIGLAGCFAVIAAAYVQERRDTDETASPTAYVFDGLSKAGETITDLFQQPFSNSPSNHVPSTLSTPAAAHSRKQERQSQRISLTRSDSPRATAGGNAHLCWGVIQKSDTQVYDSGGHFLRTVDPGTLVEITDIKSLKDGEFACCVLHYQGATIPNLLIRVSQLDIQNGSLAQASEREKNLRIRQARLTHEIEQLRHQAQADLKKGNPHAMEFNRAKEEYKKFSVKVRDLLAKRDAATGAKKVEYSDRLRQMMSDGVKYNQAYESSKKRYSAWQIEQNAKIGDNPQIRNLKSDWTRVQEELFRIQASGH